MAAPIYLIDTSAYTRLEDPAVERRVTVILDHGRLAFCQMVALEVLNTARTRSEYDETRRNFLSYRWIDVNAAAMDRAMVVHGNLAADSQHRNFKLPDLIIAATAELNGATVLHYDHDYDRIAKITGQPTEWVAAKGSV